MTKKLLKQMVSESFDKKGELIEKMVLEIASKLSRNDLKNYIFALKTSQAKATVLVKAPSELSEKQKKELESLYNKKRISFEIDPSLLLGIEIIDNDMVYNMNLKARLEGLTQHVGN